LRPYPDTIADHEPAVVASLQHGLIADEDTVADVEGLRVPQADAEPDPSPRAAAPDKRAEAHATHHAVEPGAAATEPVEQGERVLATALVPQLGRQLDLEGRVGRQPGYARNGGDDANLGLLTFRQQARLP
jgi:hypothetical protein